MRFGTLRTLRFCVCVWKATKVWSLISADFCLLLHVPASKPEKVFVSQECQASQRKGLTSGEVWGKSGELPGKSGKLPGKLWIDVKFHSERTSGEVARELPGKSPGNFWEVQGTSGEVRGLSRSSGEPDSLQRLAKFGSNYPKQLLRLFFGTLKVKNNPKYINNLKHGHFQLFYCVFSEGF